MRITSTRDAAALLEEDNDFDLLISDLMRNDPEECITFGWMCELMGADREAEPEVIRRLDGTEVAFAVRKTRDGTLVHERREGVSFVVCLRAHSGWSPVVQKIPVLFYASFSAVEALSYARPAMLAGFDTDVTISAETLIPAAVRMIAASRSSPIRVGGAKAFVPGGQTRRPLSPDIREADAGASELVRTNPN